MKGKNATTFHVVALPYPGRGHVNPMMNLCKSLAGRGKDQNALIVTFVVTEEWLNLIIDEHPTSQIRFRTIPNVLPSEVVRGSDFGGFYEAVMTEMEAPVGRLLDRIHPPPSFVVADAELAWAVPAANRRKVPVASLWTMSASVFSMFRCFDLIRLRCFQAHKKDYVDCIPGISSMLVSDLPSIFHENSDQRVTKLALECVLRLEDAQFVLVNTVYELEPQVIDALKQKCRFPIYPIGPAIPYFEPTSRTEADYLQWLDSQPKASVLYISLGSYLSVSDAQMEEIAAGVRKSNARFLWVARGESGKRAREACGVFNGLVVPWCDQLRVLCHPSTGGFLTHCGWNSTLEGVHAGVPMLTFPISFDQIPNGKQIVDDWKVGWRLRKSEELERVVTRDEISETVQRFMDSEDHEAREIRGRAREIGMICRKATEKGGSTEDNLDELIKDMSKCFHGC